MKDLSHYRRSYEKNSLIEEHMPDSPMQLFSDWFHEVDGGETEANAMTLSTISPDGFPKARVVLMKKYSEEGFVFFTNYHSEKGRSIEDNPHVCLSFFWPVLERQVIIKGIAEKTDSDTSDSYFDSRPLGSRLGAIVSDQSSVVASRAFLEQKLQEAEREAATGRPVGRPEHWGGYLVRPVEIEFWQGRANRLHDRIRFTATDKQKHLWQRQRLAP